MSSFKIGRWAKALNGTAVATGLALVAALMDGTVTGDEGFAIGLTFLTALAGIRLVQNALSGPLAYAKAGIAGLVAGVGSLATTYSAVGWPIPLTGWLIAAGALVNAALVWATSDAAESDATAEPQPRRALIE